MSAAAMLSRLAAGDPTASSTHHNLLRAALDVEYEISLVGRSDDDITIKLRDKQQRARTA